jgi:hypothetical protein
MRIARDGDLHRLWLGPAFLSLRWSNGLTVPSAVSGAA